MKIVVDMKRTHDRDIVAPSKRPRHSPLHAGELGIIDACLPYHVRGAFVKLVQRQRHFFQREMTQCQREMERGEDRSLAEELALLREACNDTFWNCMDIFSHFYCSVNEKVCQSAGQQMNRVIVRLCAQSLSPQEVRASIPSIRLAICTVLKELRQLGRSPTLRFVEQDDCILIYLLCDLTLLK
jgi:hypothetical protein